MNRKFSVSVEKEVLIFSAAHFITLGESECESLHGHNYRVACRVAGGLDPNSCVVDFIWLKNELLKITAKLDHRVLLPTEHPIIDVGVTNQEVSVQFQDRRWVFPERDVAFLPVDNTTAERIAEFIGERLLERLKTISGIKLDRLSMGVDENEGQWAWCEFPADGSE